MEWLKPKFDKDDNLIKQHTPTVSEIHDQYYGPGGSLVKKLLKDERGSTGVSDRATEINKAKDTGPTRGELMLAVKEMGIKYFRIMNKAELLEVTKGTEPSRLTQIQQEALWRWKQSASKKKGDPDA